MTPLSLKSAVITYLRTEWTRTDIYQPNTGYTRPSESHIVPWFRPGIASALEDLGATDRVGVFIIQIFTPLNVGTDEGLGHGGALEALFRNKNVGDIWFQAGDQVPRTEEIGIDKELQTYQHNTVVPFTVISEA